MYAVCVINKNINIYELLVNLFDLELSSVIDLPKRLRKVQEEQRQRREQRRDDRRQQTEEHVTRDQDPGGIFEYLWQH